MPIIDICGLELLFNNPITRKNAEKIKIIAKIKERKTDMDLRVCTIDLKKNTISINNEFIDVEAVDARTRIIKKYKSYLVNAFMRVAVLKPNLYVHKKRISQWDDIILGLDTNLFYNCAVTSTLLDGFLKIPSGNFIDTPDWVTLVLSKVAMGEIENMANHSSIPLHRRQALRAIQEIMLINKSKDLEGVSMFIAGTIPASFDFFTKNDSAGESKNTIRDATIREQFRVFLKNLDFHKGSYFVTEDFNNAVLGEAEGLNSMYIKKPELKDTDYELFLGDKVNISEILYELAVTFDWLDVEINKNTVIRVSSMWKDKTLEDWEHWKIAIDWKKDSKKLREHINKQISKGIYKDLIEGWKILKMRYVTSVV